MKVLAILEPQGGKWHRMSLETFAAARELGAKVEVGVLGEDASGLPAKVYAVQHPLLANYTADGYTAAFEALIRKVNPELVLFPHTYQTRDFAPRLATRFEAGPGRSDVIAARVDSAGPVFVRQLFQGKLNGDVRASGPGPHFASLQAGAWRAEALQKLVPARVETFTPELNAAQIRQIAEPPFRESAPAVDLTAAKRITFQVGRGIR